MGHLENIVNVLYANSLYPIKIDIFLFNIAINKYYMPLYQCRFCDNYTKDKTYYYYNHLHSHNTPDNVCKLSEEELKLCEYYHSKVTQAKLKYCQNNKDKIKDYLENNKDILAQKRKEYYQNNKELKKQQVKEYYQNNKDKITQKNKEYRQNNKDILAQKRKEYYQNNKDKIAQKLKEYRLKKKFEKQLHGKEIDDDDEIIIEEN